MNSSKPATSHKHNTSPHQGYQPLTVSVSNCYPGIRFPVPPSKKSKNLWDLTSMFTMTSNRSSDWTTRKSLNEKLSHVIANRFTVSSQTDRSREQPINSWLKVNMEVRLSTGVFSGCSTLRVSSLWPCDELEVIKCNTLVQVK